MEPKEILKEELKKEGIEIAEETAIAAAKAAFRILPKLAAASENKFDDMFVPFLLAAEPKVLELLDNINKADNE